jgi:hypothetical protein
MELHAQIEITEREAVIHGKHAFGKGVAFIDPVFSFQVCRIGRNDIIVFVVYLPFTFVGKSGEAV